MPVKEKQMLPFAMLFLDNVTNEARGYDDFDDESLFTYNAKLQTSNTIFMGGTLVLSSLEERDSDTKADSED